MNLPDDMRVPLQLALSIAMLKLTADNDQFQCVLAAWNLLDAQSEVPEPDRGEPVDIIPGERCAGRRDVRLHYQERSTRWSWR